MSRYMSIFCYISYLLCMSQLVFYCIHTAVPTSTILCQAQTVGLTRYPTTLAPASGTLSVTTQCADNAHRTSSSLSVTCSSSGIWGSQTPQCQCDSGYQTTTVNGRQICQGTCQYSAILLTLYVTIGLLLYTHSCSNFYNTLSGSNSGSSSLSYYTSSSQWNTVCDYTVC